MATTSIEGLSKRDGCSVGKTLVACINYGKNKLKTDGGRLVTAKNCEIETAYAEMLFLQKQYEKITGKIVDAPCGVDEKTGEVKTAPVIYIMMQSFKPDETTPDIAHEIGVKLAQDFLGNDYQYTVNTHTDKEHIHNHIYFNAVNLDCKHKFNCTKTSFRKVRNISDRLCEEYGLSVVIPGQERRSQIYSKCAANSFRECLKNDMDENLKNSKSYLEFLDLMRKDYFVVTDGKHLKFKHRTNGQQKYIRSYSVGTDYDEASLRKSFDVNKVPQQKIKMSFTQKLKAKTKVKQNKEKSYSQRLQNVKALFFTLGVINDNGVTKYSELIDCIDNTINSVDEANSKLETLTNRINDIDGLLTAIDIVNDKQSVVDEYNRSLLKSKYYNEHEYDIDLYNVADKKLTSNGLTSSQECKNKLVVASADCKNSLDEIRGQVDLLNKKLGGIHLARDIVDRLHSNQSRLITGQELNSRRQR